MYDRDALATPITGPAIIEESFATHLIGPGWTATPGPAGALIATRPA